jgi:2-oxoglutarate dehydrogenase E2 component (dihydrolipoamide succinyltransferase)
VRLGVIAVDGEAVSDSLSVPAGGEGEEAPQSDSPGPPPRLSPVVKRLLAMHGLTPDEIKGTGAAGRIKRGDVEAWLARGHTDGSGAGRTVIPFNTIRKRTAEHMVRSRATSPHVLQAVEADFHRVERARAMLAADWKAREGFSLTFLPFIARAVCEAIADFPHVNATVEGEALVVWRDIHLGIAVDLDFEGLVAPVIRDAQAMSVAGLARAIADRAAKARTKALSPDDYAGGTYSISNSGVFGTLITAPIINQPQVAILSTDGIRKRPVVVETPDGDAIVIRPVGVLAQSFDHRAIDGAYSAAFLGRVRDIIEERDWRDALS